MTEGVATHGYAVLIGLLTNVCPIVAYCNHHHRGVARCEQAAELLHGNGFEARALDGDYPGWKVAGYPVEEPVKVSD